MNLRNILGMITISGGAISLFLSLTAFFNGEFEKATILALYAILAWLMIPEKTRAI